MKKSCLGVLIGLLVFSGSFFVLKAPGLFSTVRTGQKNGSETLSNGARSARTEVGSLPGALRSVFSQTLGADNPKYRLTRSGNGYRAVNVRNRLTATMGLEGFRVRRGSNEWGLRLTAWGAGRCLKKIEAGRAVSGPNRVAIDRGGIVEWWVNGPVGIEQGWTVANRPRRGEERGRLTLVLRQSGNLRTRALPNGRSLSVSSETGRAVLRYTGLTAYDKNGRPLPAHFEVTGRVVRVVVDDTSAVYPVRIDPWVQAAKLTASDGVANDGLGDSVAVSSDGTTIVVGMPETQIGSSGSYAAVYVFKEGASGWANGTQAAKLTASDSALDDSLGSSVAVSSDGKTIVAGAPWAEEGSNAKPGIVYVFKEPASGWADETEVARLTASDAANGNQLGHSVALSSDGSTVVAGAPEATIGSYFDPGAVYVFKEPASGWADGTETAKLTASESTLGDSLGWSVAVSSDGTTVAAGATYASASNAATGAVDVFKEPASGWADGTETAELSPSDQIGYDLLGSSVAVSSDGATVVAGATGGTQGAVYVYKEPASGWANGTETAKLTPWDVAANDYVGSSVAVSADGATVVAGSATAGVVYFHQGAVYVFKEPASGWANGIQAARLAASDGALGDLLGTSVAMSSNGATVVAGAPRATIGNNGSQGAVYVFSSGSLWQNATNYGNDWEGLGWFGLFNISGSPWIYHQTLGWLYPFGTSTDSIWFWDPQWDGTGGWWWTSSSNFPWVYSSSEGAWFYYDPAASTPGARWFWNSSTGWAVH